MYCIKKIPMQAKVRTLVTLGPTGTSMTLGRHPARRPGSAHGHWTPYLAPSGGSAHTRVAAQQLQAKATG